MNPQFLYKIKGIHLMSSLGRRDFLTLMASGLFAFPYIATSATLKRVVIIGGGAGGTIAAKSIRLADPSIHITLVEPHQHYYTCFMSNQVLSGERRFDTIRFNYDNLRRYGIQIRFDQGIAIDPINRQLKLQSGATLTYDRLILSPGIDFQWDVIEGYDEKTSHQIPHAWKAGPQTILLRQQLAAIPNGGTLIISVPQKPFRCPAAPYERASQIAHYFKYHKPRSKLFILDAKSAFSQQQLFIEGWKKLYGFGTENSLIEWIPAHEQGTVIAVDAQHKTVYAGEFEDEYQADVINIIPPQRAAHIAKVSGLVDESGWCPINQKTFESSLQKGIHVIGDACITKMPKSAHSANSQAKICAQAVVAALQDREMTVDAAYMSSCYEIVGKDFGISFLAHYRLKEGVISQIKGVGGLSPLNASAADRKREVAYAHSWYQNITSDMFN